MCQCYGGTPIYYQYSPYQFYGVNFGYPLYGYWYPSYGLPVGYAYVNPALPLVYGSAPQCPRGEHRVGNCLMVCQ